MVLTLDVGNTNINLGLFDGDTICMRARFATQRDNTDDQFAVLLHTLVTMHGIDPAAIQGGIISSVVPELTAELENAVYILTGKKPLCLVPGVKTGLNILIDNPAQLGSDLVVDSVAAIAEYPVPMLIFDMGTANTVCVIDKNKNYIGGMIYPGIGVSMDSLTAHASQLGGIGLEAPEHIIGKNTVECMKSGAIYSSAAAIDGLIDRLEEELDGEVTVIATGGLAKKIVPYCRRKLILDDELLLKGLAVIYRKNRR